MSISPEVTNTLMAKTTQITDLALATKHLECIIHMIVGLIALGCLPFAIKKLHSLYVTFEEDEKGFDQDWQIFIIIAICLGLISVAFINLMNFWNWVGIFAPDKVLMHTILSSTNVD